MKKEFEIYQDKKGNVYTLTTELEQLLLEDLVEIYSTQEILLFLVIFASAVKGFVSFWDWGYARLKQMFKKENDTNKIEILN